MTTQPPDLKKLAEALERLRRVAAIGGSSSYATVLADDLRALLDAYEDSAREVEAIEQAITSPSNQPSQFGTVTLDMYEEAQKANNDSYLSAIREVASLRDENEKLREALSNVLTYVVSDTLEHCDGNKCRNLWCIGCYGEEEAMDNVAKANAASAKAYALLNDARHATQGD